MEQLEKCLGCEVVYLEKGSIERPWYGFCKECTVELVIVTNIVKEIGVK